MIPPLEIEKLCDLCTENYKKVSKRYGLYKCKPDEILENLEDSTSRLWNEIYVNDARDHAKIIEEIGTHAIFLVTLLKEIEKSNG